MTGDDQATHRVRSTRVCIAGDLVPATVEIDPAGRVRAIEPAGGHDHEQVTDLGDAVVAPAPLDLHIHGAGGFVVPPEHQPRALDAVLDAMMRRLTHVDAPVVPRCSWLATLPLPTTAAAPVDEQVAGAAAMVAGDAASGCVGIRVEGMFLNPRRAGVWPAELLRSPDSGLLEAMVAAARDAGSTLRVVDVAPELDGAIELIERACELGVVVALAHSDATWEQARRAIDAGASLATHTWNAMRPLSHRDPGIVAAVLTDERVTCELICDGVHLHVGTVSLSIAAAGRGGWCAVSDASPLAGLGPGTHRWAGLEVTSDGVALRDAHGNLAGSAGLLDHAMGTMRDAGVSLLDRVLAVGAVPRRVLDPQRPLGLQDGDPAWIVATD